MNIENINLENAFVTARYGAEFSESKDITFKNVTVIPEEGPAYMFHNVKNFKTENLSYEIGERQKAAVITGRETSGLQLSGLQEELAEIAPEVESDKVVFK